MDVSLSFAPGFEQGFDGSTFVDVASDELPPLLLAVPDRIVRKLWGADQYVEIVRYAGCAQSGSDNSDFCIRVIRRTLNYLLLAGVLLNTLLARLTPTRTVIHSLWPHPCAALASAKIAAPPERLR